MRNSIIVDVNNRFYSGMTLTDAKKYGIDKSFWRRDFHNLDKNKDGILSKEEVIKERKRSANIQKLWGVGFILYAAYDAFQRKSKFWPIFDGLFAFMSLHSASKMDKQTKVYQKQLELNG